MGRAQRFGEYAHLFNIEYRNKNKYSILNIEYRRDKKHYSAEQARQKASYLADKFKNPNGLAFYLKCAWNLTDQYIDWLVEYSSKKDSPCRYFIKVANRKMLEIV